MFIRTLRSWLADDNASWIQVILAMPYHKNHLSQDTQCTGRSETVPITTVRVNEAH